MIYLAQQGYQVIGVELNVEACEQFYLENKLSYQKTRIQDFDIFQSGTITLLSGDFFKLNKMMLEEIDAIYDRAALVALPEKMRIQYAQKIIDLSHQNTQMLLITISYNQSEMPGPPFSVDKSEVDKLYNQHFLITALHDAPVLKISEHLKAKGLRMAQELVFKLSRINSK